MAKQRPLRLIGVLFLLSTMVAACGGDRSQPSIPSSESLPDGASNGIGAPAGWSGTITMFAQAYTPNAPESKRPLKAFREIADAYEQIHPGIKIEFIDEPSGEINDAIRVKAAEGELWDVFWAQWASLNSTLPDGIAVDLAPYFEQKNPYIAEAPRWKEVMNQTIVDATADVDGAHYNINGDFVATAFFYNRDLLQQAGVSTTPKTWPELLDLCRKLQASGITPFVGVPYYSWWARHFLTDFYANDYEQIAGFDQAPGVSALDQAAAMRRGQLHVDDPRFMGWWPVFKSFTDYWAPEYLAQSPDNQLFALEDFIAGKAAMHYSGSWLPNELRDAEVSFEYGAFNFPLIGLTASEYSTGTDTANASGGPNAGFQYAMSTSQANATMKEAGKPAAVLDWLRFIGRPEVIEKIVNEEGSFLPTWPGTTPNMGSELLASQASQKLQALDSTSVSPQLGNDIQQVFGSYLAGQVSLDESRGQMQQVLDRSLQDFLSKNNVKLDR